MNGISLNDYRDFQKNWKFVTVRYRKDTGEMRFTYANPLAYKTLISRKFPYPEGSVFGKISIVTQKDHSFPSSMVPSGGRRIQFMVRNRKKYEKTGGWGYALFDPGGHRFTGDVASKSMACASCHNIVKDRGEVFSQPLAMVGFLPEQRSGQSDWKTRIQFEWVKSGDIPENLHKYTLGSRVRSIKGQLRKHLFYGTLDEIRPVLIEEFKSSKAPAALFSEDFSQYSIVYPGETGQCAKGEVAMRSVHTVPNKKNPRIHLSLCETP